MSNLVKHAEYELTRAGFLLSNNDCNNMLGEAILELIKAMAAQEHSGASAPIVIEMFSKVAKFKPLTPLTSDPEEWMDVSAAVGGKPLWQSKRDPHVFSNDGGKTWHSNNWWSSL